MCHDWIWVLALLLHNPDTAGSDLSPATWRISVASSLPLFYPLHFIFYLYDKRLLLNHKHEFHSLRKNRSNPIPPQLAKYLPSPSLPPTLFPSFLYSVDQILPHKCHMKMTMNRAASAEVDVKNPTTCCPAATPQPALCFIPPSSNPSRLWSTVWNVTGL